MTSLSVHVSFKLLLWRSLCSFIDMLSLQNPSGISIVGIHKRRKLKGETDCQISILHLMYMKFQNFTFDYNKIAKSLLFELSQFYHNQWGTSHFTPCSRSICLFFFFVISMLSYIICKYLALLLCLPSFAQKSHIVVVELVLVPSWYSLMFAQSEGLILLSKVACRLCNNITSIALSQEWLKPSIS